MREGASAYAAGYDGGGDVTALLDAATGAVAASYDYGPFGDTLKAAGAYAGVNPFRFSTKYADSETGLLYYGYRYYNPATVKWISRDPIAETGGLNLYGFVGNDAVGSVDHLGLWKRVDTWTGGWGHYSGSVEAECGDSLSRLAVLITGYASDWHALRIAENVEPGQKVDISPLLEIFEERLRAEVVNATGKFQAGQGFPQAPQTQLPPDNAAGVNIFFRPNNWAAACQFAVRVVMAKGLNQARGFLLTTIFRNSRSSPVYMPTERIGEQAGRC